jgi:hypothetical protein
LDKSDTDLGNTLLDKSDTDLGNTLLDKSDTNLSNIIAQTNDIKLTENNQTKQTKQTKQNLGQFYTTNQDYILQGMAILDNVKTIIEPFAGKGDLLKFIKEPQQYTIECYDIDPKNDTNAINATNDTNDTNYEDVPIIKRDTLTNPPIYTNKFILTNPPYLARNKSKSKVLFDKYDVNDLYKCFIKELITNQCIGGIIIIPLNFWSSIRNGDIKLRKDFLQIYTIQRLNIFEEQVFEDTTYTTCAFQFANAKLMGLKDNNKLLNIMIYPGKHSIITELDSINYLIGGDIYNLKTNKKNKITRATSNNKDKLNTNILVKCIDDNKNNKIGLSFVATKALYIDNTPNLSSRTYATLIITPAIDEDKQKQLVAKFNSYLEEHRKKYNSLFLTNYRESKDIARKRISFDLVYLIVDYILENFDTLLAKSGTDLGNTSK